MAFLSAYFACVLSHIFSFNFYINLYVLLLFLTLSNVFVLLFHTETKFKCHLAIHGKINHSSSSITVKIVEATTINLLWAMGWDKIQTTDIVQWRRFSDKIQKYCIAEEGKGRRIMNSKPTWLYRFIYLMYFTIPMLT